MSRKLLASLVFLLLVLVGVAGWIYNGGVSAWKKTDTRTGAPVLPGLVISNVASMRLNGGKEQTTLELKNKVWTVHERDGYPADVAKIGPLLVKLADLKVIQTDTITDALAPRLKLAPPGQADGGIALDLADASAKPLGSLVLGKTIDKDSEIPGATKKMPYGRYLIKREQPTVSIAINDPLNEADTSPRAWIDKTFIKPERIKTFAVTSGGKPRYILSRSEEAAMAWTLKDAAKGEDLDTGRAQDVAGALAGITMVDVLTAPKPDELGLTDGDVITAETFDGLTYTLTVGKKEGENRALALGVTGKPERARERTPGKEEKAEDKTKLDKDFKDQLAGFDQRVQRELAMDKKVFLVADAGVQGLLTDRAKLMKQKESVAAPSVPGLDKFEKKPAEKKAPAKK
ncbi:MAG: uncharacterized protein JWN73_2863 [Betaproteobacteria bacterium]|nr:uncharacterized protein [Betaproteobacteria bacterium]